MLTELTTKLHHDSSFIIRTNTTRNATTNVHVITGVGQWLIGRSLAKHLTGPLRPWRQTRGKGMQV